MNQHYEPNRDYADSQDSEADQGSPAPLESSSLDTLDRAFRDQLVACLEECSRGRNGLFSDVDLLEDESPARSWPEAARLRELAMALQNVFAQQEEQNPLVDEFLDLCSMHGESHPGERRLAQAFLKRTEKDQVGQQPGREANPW